MSIRRFIPQWLAVAVCTTFRHPAKRFSAWQDGVQIVVYTCRCGRKQNAERYAANRRIRRAASKARRRAGK